MSKIKLMNFLSGMWQNGLCLGYEDRKLRTVFWGTWIWYQCSEISSQWGCNWVSLKSRPFCFLPAFRHSGVPAFRWFGVPAIRHSGVWAFRCSGVPAVWRSSDLAFRRSGVPVFRRSVVSTFRSSGVFRHSGVPAFQLSGEQQHNENFFLLQTF